MAATLTIDDALPMLLAQIEAELEGLRPRTTCRKGCAACCHQLVPVSPAEARRLKRVINDMLPEKRAAVVRRFAVARDALEEAGLLDLLDAMTGGEDVPPAEIRVWLAAAWQEAEVACPFLEADQTCGIYTDRPLACRLKLVASDPACCTDNPARVVPLSIKGRPAVLALTETEEATWLPLTSVAMVAADASGPKKSLSNWLTTFTTARV